MTSAISQTVAVIGAGSMGAAIASGLVASGVCDPSRVVVTDHHDSKLAALADVSGVRTASTAEKAMEAGPDVVIVAVKPQVLPALLVERASSFEGRLVISIAAGIAISSLEALLPESRVVRVMPNLPVAQRSGASAICAGPSAGQADVDLACRLFSALGSTGVMREDQLDAESAVVGCAPAYFALMIDTFTRAGIRAGLPAATCRELLESTMLGVAKALLDSGEHPRAYMERVTSPGGTTAAALTMLEPALSDGSYAAIDEALRRCEELAGASSAKN